MKNETKIVVLISLFAIMTTTAQADEFIKPPETYAPVWYTPFPYQRNIDMGFAVNPVAAPSDTGIPGAVYEGTLDPSLLSSDYVTFTGAVTWYTSVSGFTQTGLIGIDNRAGNSTLFGTATFHIDNIDDNLPLKDVWIESLTLSTGIALLVYPEVFDPNGNEATYPINNPGQISYNGYQLGDYEAQITPNPSYETIVMTYAVPAGDYALIDDLHIATECVPEPATVSLLALGALALLRRRQGKI